MSQWTVSSRRCNVCSVDKTVSSEQLHLCSGCRLIRYCSKKHQQLDWNIHKSFCQAIRHILKSKAITHVMDLEGPVSSWIDFEKVLILNKCLLHTILKRQLDNHEVELLTFPVHCQICFSRNGKELFNCESCEAVSYCSLDHQNEDSSNHSKWCRYLKYYYNYFQIEGFKLDLDFTNVPVLHVASFPKELFSLIEATVPTSGSELKVSKEPNTVDDYQHYVAVSGFSCVATLLHTINVCNLALDNKDMLSIYLIGSRDEHRFLEKIHCAFLASQLPNIQKIKFYLIGPEVRQPSKPIRYSIRNHNRQINIKINFYCEKFEDFAMRKASKCGLNKKPHLIAAFNCGFYEYAGSQKNTWKEGITALFNFNRIPIVFTSYTKLESSCDLQEFTACANAAKQEYRIVVNGEENPYKDYRPFRNMELRDRKDLVYFRNGYFHVVLING